MLAEGKAVLTIRSLLMDRALANPAAAALDGPTGSVSYGGLLATCEAIYAQLTELGFRTEDRIAIVLRDHRQISETTLGVSMRCAAAPIDPANTGSEMELHFSTLQPAAVIAAEGDEAAAAAASRSGASLIRVTRRDDGELKLTGSHLSRGGGNDATPDSPGLNDVGIILSTSGSTGAPKFVPRTHRNLLDQAFNVSETLGLLASDRCLQLSSPVHSFALAGGLLSTLWAGASLVCADGFRADDVFDWVRRYRPTWYAAVPVQQSALLGVFRRDPAAARAAGIRLARCSAGFLSDTIISELGRLLGAEVIATYGASEVGQATSNHPWPGPSKRGTVGVASPTQEVAVVDGEGKHLPPGQAGEVVVRGPSVIAGYLFKEPHSADDFYGDWFRMGDLGSMDEEGFLTIKGRLKDVIRSGGESISPSEVEQALEQHPDVLEAGAFGIFHPTLEEVVGAAVVLADGSAVSSDDLLAFCRQHLAPHKLPRQLLIVDQLPRTATGKVRRAALAEDAQRRAAPPHREGEPTPLAAILQDIWLATLGRTGSVDREEDFFLSGGDSLLAVGLLLAIEEKCGVAVEPPETEGGLTFGRLVALVEQQRNEGVGSPLVRLREGDTAAPLFCVPGSAQSAFRLETLANALRRPRSVFGFVGSGGLATVEEVAQRNSRAALAAIEPGDGVVVAGFSFGALVAYEMAVQMEREGRAPALLVLIDGYAYAAGSLSSRLRTYLRRIESRSPVMHAAHVYGDRALFRQKINWSLRAMWRRRVGRVPWDDTRLNTGAGEWDSNAVARRMYRPVPYAGRVLVIATLAMSSKVGDVSLGWSRWVTGVLTTKTLDVAHIDLLGQVDVGQVAGWIEAAEEHS